MVGLANGPGAVPTSPRRLALVPWRDILIANGVVSLLLGLAALFAASRYATDLHRWIREASADEFAHVVRLVILVYILYALISLSVGFIWLAVQAYATPWGIVDGVRAPEGKMTGKGRPLVVCLCGSTDLMDKFAEVNRDETLNGYIVLSVGVNMKDTSQPFLKDKSEAEIAIIKEKLDWLHRRKIDLADVIVVLKTGGKDLGESTRKEKEYGQRSGKIIEIREFPAT